MNGSNIVPTLSSYGKLLVYMGLVNNQAYFVKKMILDTNFDHIFTPPLERGSGRKTQFA